MYEESENYNVAVMYEDRKEEKKDNSLAKFLKKALGINLVGFLVGRASILGGISPFGVAFFAALFGTKINVIPLFISINIGILTVGMGSMQFKYIIASVLFSITNLIIPIDAKRNMMVGLRVFSCVFIVGTILTFYNGFLVYDFLLNLFEAFMAFVLVLIFKNALSFLDANSQKKISQSEQIISIAIIGVLVITGISDIAIWGFNIRNISIISLILIFAYRNGASVGAAIGITSGLIISMSTGSSPLVIGAYGFCGLMAGVFKDLGKVGLILGFLLANAIITIYMNGSTEVLINILDIVAAGMIIICLSRKKIIHISDFFVKPALELIQKKSKAERVKDVTSNKLKGFSSSFAQLAKTFNKISEKNINVNKEDVSSLFEEVAQRVCRDCPSNTNCWNKEFYNTYQTMFEILEKLEQKGRIDTYDTPTYFRNKCLRIDEFVSSSNFMYELYKINLLWQKKIIESRTLIAQQLDGVSKIIGELADEIHEDVYFKTELEKEIKLEFIKKDIEVEEIMVVENKYGKYEVNISHAPCKNKKQCSMNVLPIVSKILGRRMIKEEILCSWDEESNSCQIKLLEQENFRVATGVAVVNKGNEMECGDNYNVLSLKDGKIVIAISDGMGSGNKAAKESKATIDLLEKFMQSGFDKYLSIKLINSILVLKSFEESFSTIDLSIVDLFSGEVEFAKIGAASTFIKRPNKIEVVKSTSLPAGILSDVDIELNKKDLDDGDMIIMVSDGVLDSKKDILRKEDWIIDVLTNINTSNPQEIADYLMERAKENLGGKQDDDMTVLVSKMLERVS